VQNNDAITNTWIHNLVIPNGAHVDGIQSAGGNALLIQHNTVDCNSGQGCNDSAIFVGADLGSFTGLQNINDNIAAGGGFTLRGGNDPGFKSAGEISFTNNRIVGGYYGPCSFNVTVVFTGNVNDSTGSPLSCGG
jgi:hypothetical protein